MDADNTTKISVGDIIEVGNTTTGKQELVVSAINTTVVSTKTNKGYAGGCNFGAKYADGDYIVFLNNDTVVDQKWLIELIKLMDEKPTIASIQPKIMKNLLLKLVKKIY